MFKASFNIPVNYVKPAIDRLQNKFLVNLNAFGVNIFIVLQIEQKQPVTAADVENPAVGTDERFDKLVIDAQSYRSVHASDT